MHKQIRKIVASSLCLLFLTGCATQAEANVVYGVVTQNIKSTDQACKFVTLNPETGAVINTFLILERMAPIRTQHSRPLADMLLIIRGSQGRIENYSSVIWKHRNQNG